MRAAAHPRVYALPEDLRGRDHRRRRGVRGTGGRVGATDAVVDAASREHVPGRRRRPARREAASSTGKDWRPRAAWCTTRTRTPRTRRSPAARRRALPFDWTFETTPGGVTPGKSNIRDAWSAVDQTSGRTFLYLAFARDAPVGTTFLTFELNHVGGTWKNDKGVRVPCRRDGDILVSYEISGTDGGGVPAALEHGDHGRCVGLRPDRHDRAVHARCRTTWRCRARSTGCEIANHLGGFGAEIPAFQFGEVALDLDALLGQAFEGGCYAFGSIWMHSRSSTSYTSQMQDYVAPAPIDLRTCAAEGVKFFDLDADGVRDPNEPGIPGFQIFADYNDEREARPGRAVDRERPRPGVTCSATSVVTTTRCASGSCRPAGARRTTGGARSRTRTPTAGSERPAPACRADGGRSTPTRSPTRRAGTSATGIRRS